MANLVIPRREIWTQQPQGPVEVDPQFADRAGQILLPSQGGGMFTHGGAPVVISGAGYGKEITSKGVSYKHGGYLARASLPGSKFGTGIGGGLLVVFRTTTTGTDERFGAFGTDSGSSGNSIFSIGVNASSLRVTLGGSNSNYVFEYSGVGANNGNVHAVVLTISGHSLGTEFFSVAMDGRLLAIRQNIASLGTLVAFNYVISGGYRRGGTDSPSANGNVLMVVPFVGGALTDSEARSLSTNPWQIFAPQSRQLFVPVGGGGSVNANASGALSAVAVTAPSASASGSASATGALATITISSPTATASAGGSASASGSFAALSISPANATATATKSATASGAFAAISLSAPTATATGTTAGGANATCTPAQITISHAAAIAIGSAVASGGYQSIGITAPTGSASVGSGNATASGAWAAISITAPTAYASSGFIRAPAGSGPTVIQPGSIRPRQSATSRPSNTGGRRY